MSILDLLRQGADAGMRARLAQLAAGRRACGRCNAMPIRRGCIRRCTARTKADGVLYTSRFNGRRCVALFDRAQDAVAIGRTAALPSEEAHALAARFGKRYVDP